jgi:hypothetical protein
MESATPLEALLGKDTPDSVLALDPEVQSRLADQIRAARAHQLQLIEDSINTAVHGVPLPVRGIVRKALLR